VRNLKRTLTLFAIFVGFLIVFHSCNHEIPISAINQNNADDIPSGHALSVFVRSYDNCQDTSGSIYVCGYGGQTVFIKDLQSGKIILRGVTETAVDEFAWVNFDPSGGIASGWYVAYCPGNEGLCGAKVFEYTAEGQDIEIVGVQTCK
jgi:hypothetical protein